MTKKPEIYIHWGWTHWRQFLTPFAEYIPQGDDRLPRDATDQSLLQIEWLGFVVEVWWRGG